MTRASLANARRELALLAVSSALPVLVPAACLLSAYAAWQLGRRAATPPPAAVRPARREVPAPSLN